MGYPKSKECMKYLCDNKIGLDYKTEASCDVNEDQDGISLLEFSLVENQIEYIKTLLRHVVCFPYSATGFI